MVKERLPRGYHDESREINEEEMQIPENIQKYRLGYIPSKSHIKENQVEEYDLKFSRA